MVKIKDNFLYLDRNSNIYLIENKEKWKVIGWLNWIDNIPIVYDKRKNEKSEEIYFIFNRLTHSEWEYIEKNILEEEKENGEIKLTYNFFKMRIFILRFLLYNWSLPIPLQRNGNELTEESFVRVVNIYPSILNYFLRKIEMRIFLLEDEKKEIAKQCLKLFGVKSIGVENPKPAISLYCNLSSFWEKFGLNYFDLLRLPQDLFIQLKTVLNHEIDIRNQMIRNDLKPKPKSNVKFGRGRSGQTTNLMRF